MIIRGLSLKRNLKKTPQLSRKNLSTTTINSYYSNIFHTFIGGNRFGLLGIAVPILNYDTEFLHLSPDSGFRVMLIKAAGHNRSFRSIFSQRCCSHGSFTLPIGTLQGLNSVSKQIGLKYGIKLTSGWLGQGRHWWLIATRERNKWWKPHFFGETQNHCSFSPVRAQGCTGSSVCRAGTGDTE